MVCCDVNYCDVPLYIIHDSYYLVMLIFWKWRKAMSCWRACVFWLNYYQIIYCYVCRSIHHSRWIPTFFIYSCHVGIYCRNKCKGSDIAIKKSDSLPIRAIPHWGWRHLLIVGAYRFCLRMCCRDASPARCSRAYRYG